MTKLSDLFACLIVTSCFVAWINVAQAAEEPKALPAHPTFGRIERLDPRIDDLIPKDAKSRNSPRDA
jgi:hypothetical protein